MAYTEVEARGQILDHLAHATDELGGALAAVGAAYEQLDEQQGDRVEQQLFRPIQRAYGRAQRTHTEFANRYGLSARQFARASAGLPSSGVKGFLEAAVDALQRADLQLVALQESDVTIDVGDPELRSGLTEVRQLIDPLPRVAQGFVRSFGR